MKNRDLVPNREGRWCFGSSSVEVLPETRRTWYKFGLLRTSNPCVYLCASPTAEITAEFLKDGVIVRFDTIKSSSVYLSNSLLASIEQLSEVLAKEYRKRKWAKLVVRLENEKILVSAEAVLPLIAVPLSNEQGNKTVTKLFLKKNEQGVLKYFEERTVKCFPVEAATNGYVKKRKKKKRR